MRPSLSLLPALTAVATLSSAALSPSTSEAIDSPLRPLAAPPAGQALAGPLHERVRLWAADESAREDNWALVAAQEFSAEDASDGATLSDDGWELERLKEEHEEREMWRELLSGLSETGTISPLFAELVCDDGARRESDQIIPDLLTLHSPPPPAWIAPPSIPPAAVYSVPKHAPAAPRPRLPATSSLKVVFLSAFDRLYSMLPSTSLRLGAQNRTSAIPLPSLAALPAGLDSLKTLSPSFSLSFAAPAGIGFSRR
ncbi:hypothetical protein JCM10207_007881 [Rhodosporidiobolus poonsookiae]